MEEVGVSCLGRGSGGKGKCGVWFSGVGGMVAGGQQGVVVQGRLGSTSPERATWPDGWGQVKHTLSSVAPHFSDEVEVRLDGGGQEGEEQEHSGHRGGNHHLHDEVEGREN